jgi:hypothetical protein
VIYPDQKFQLRGHVSQETALVVNNYTLNGILTPVRYWIETSRSYGQRVIRQMFNTRGNDWFKPKPFSTYSQIVVIYHNYAPLRPEETHNGTSKEDPVKYLQLKLDPESVPDNQIDAFLNYFNFDEYQRSIVLAYKDRRLNPPPQQDRFTASQTVETKPTQQRSGSSNPLLDELRQLKIERERQKNLEIEQKIRERELRIKQKEQILAEKQLSSTNLGNQPEHASLKRRRTESDEQYQRRLYDAKLSPFILSDRQRLAEEQKAEARLRFIQFEKDNGLYLPPRKITWPTHDSEGVIDLEFEESQREPFWDLLAYCDNHPEHVPSDLITFKARAEILQLDVSYFPFMSAISKTEQIQQSPISRTFEDDLLTPLTEAEKAQGL